MSVNIDLYFNYIIYGMFITWMFIYLNSQHPQIYEFTTKSRHKN